MTEMAVPQRTTGRAAMRGDWRLILVMICFLMCYAAVALRMAVMVATDPREPALARADAATRPVRGEIVDRNGNLLAANLPAWSLYAHPGEIKDPLAVAAALAEVFPELRQDRLLGSLTDGRRFVWIKRPISPREKQAVHDLGFPGLHFGNREIRIYPAGRASAHIVGRVKAAREAVRFAEFTGSGGAEGHFDARLSDPALAAEPLRLSLDLRVQAAMRDVLDAGMRRLTAKGASAILMRVQTGEVVGMVSLPDFDPNAPMTPPTGPAEYHPRFNRAAQGRYELGSTFKVLTAAMAIETGVVQPATVIETPPELRYGRHRIGESHGMPGEMSVEDIVVKSSNVGSARLAMMVGTARFKSYLDALGFFEPSGLELAEAARARTLLPERWTDLSSMTIAFGHGLAASPIHLAASYATLANDGVRVHPTLLADPEVRGERVFSPETAAEMVRMMREVVTRGTARRANVPGYRVGGKTGTAEKIGRSGGYDRTRVISTFAAIFPTDAPEYVLVVSLDEPTDRSGARPVRTAGRTAVPVAADMIRRIGPILGMRPSHPPPDALMSGLDASWE